MRGPRYTFGPIPYAWDLDDERHLVPSTRPAGATGFTEAEVVRAAFERIAAGSQPYAEAKRLNALGVPAPLRYGGQDEPVRTGTWRPSRVAKMIRHPLYALLVGEATWTRANALLDGRRRAPSPRAPYPLTGTITCGCGSPWVGQTQRSPGWPGGRRYYVCGAVKAPLAYPDRDCRARSIPAGWLERAAADAVRVRIDQDATAGREAALVSLETPDAPAVVRRYAYRPLARG